MFRLLDGRWRLTRKMILHILCLWGSLFDFWFWREQEGDFQSASLKYAFLLPYSSHHFALSVKRTKTSLDTSSRNTVHTLLVPVLKRHELFFLSLFNNLLSVGWPIKTNKSTIKVESKGCEWHFGDFTDSRIKRNIRFLGLISVFNVRISCRKDYMETVYL